MIIMNKDTGKYFVGWSRDIDEMFSENIHDAQHIGYNFCMKYIRLLKDLGFNVKLVKTER